MYIKKGNLLSVYYVSTFYYGSLGLSVKHLFLGLRRNYYSYALMGGNFRMKITCVLFFPKFLISGGLSFNILICLFLFIFIFLIIIIKPVLFYISIHVTDGFNF